MGRIEMKLSSQQLEAFAEVVKTGSFSKAAKNLFITQSALSQRVKNLETELETGLIIRDPSGLKVTTSGEELLRYCRVTDSLETEVLSRIQSDQRVVGGNLRIAGLSSVIRSVAMPSIDQLIRKYSEVNIELSSRELRDLPRVLSNNEADFILTTSQPHRQEVVSHQIGYEENVLIESTENTKRKNIYLDHDSEDLTTVGFFDLNKKQNKEFRRNFLDEIYTIISGVKLGWGRAVVPKHLIKKEEGIRLVRGFKPLKTPVMLQYFRQPFYSMLHDRVMGEICKNAAKILG